MNSQKRLIIIAVVIALMSAFAISKVIDIQIHIHPKLKRTLSKVRHITTSNRSNKKINGDLELCHFKKSGDLNNDPGKKDVLEAVKVWAIGDCHKINPINGKDFNPFVSENIKEKNYLWDSSSNTIRLFGAKNEYVSFQIIIEAGYEDLKNVSVKFSDLIGPSKIKSKNIKLFKEHYTKVTHKSDWPQPSTGLGEYPDALIPFDTPKFGAPFSIPKNRNQAVWVDLFIPKDVEAGKYTGSLSISTDSAKTKNMDIVLSVWDFILPDKNHLAWWSTYYSINHAYGFKNDYQRYIKIEESIWKIAHNHRFNALLQYAPITPRVTFNSYGALLLDFRPYADRLRAYLDGSLFENKLPPDIFLLPLSGGTEKKWPKGGPNNYPDATFTYACKEFAAYFKEMGWGDLLDNCYVYLADGDKLSKERIDDVIKDARLIHNADKKLNTLASLYYIFSAKTVNKLAGSLDMWLVDASLYDSKILLERKKLGEKIGFYQQGEPWCGNENLDSDGIGLRTWPWIAWKYEADCLYIYSMTEWWGIPKGHSIWESPRNKTWSNSQGILIYPGKFIGVDEVVGSVRLKQIRRGMQDYEYMYLAKKIGKDPMPIVNSIIKRALDETHRSGGNHGEWSHNPEDWFMARKKLAYLILDIKDKEEISADDVLITQRGLKQRLSVFLKRALPNKFASRIIYNVDFESGSNSSWTGGIIQDDMTYGNSKYALRDIFNGNNKYIALGIWKKFPLNKNTKLGFAYYCENTDKLIINLWSNKHKRNYSQIIHNPVQNKWIYITKDLEDFGDDIGKTVNSIHISIPNKNGAILIVDDIKLYSQ